MCVFVCAWYAVCTYVARADFIAGRFSAEGFCLQCLTLWHDKIYRYTEDGPIHEPGNRASPSEEATLFGWGCDREGWKGGIHGIWEGELGGQQQEMEKGRAGVATPSMCLVVLA